MAEQAVSSLSVIESVNLASTRQTIQKIGEFQTLVQSQLKEGHDFGVIPGTNKPTLLKPGAEKILMLMGLTSEYELTEKVQDYDKAFFAFTVRCTLLKNGMKITEGLGHANTREKRYVSGKQGDAYTLANTVLKMAKKRAQVDASLTVAALSEIFTQDVEDLDLQQQYQKKSDNQQTDIPSEDEDIKVNLKGETKTLGSLPNHSLEFYATKYAGAVSIKEAAARLLEKRRLDKNGPQQQSPMDQFSGQQAPPPEGADAPGKDEQFPFDV